MQNNLLHTPEGVRDIYGSEYNRKYDIESKLRSVFTAYAYEGVETPVFEYFDIFSKRIGTTPSRELYKFFDREGDTLVLRPDFTPAIARCYAKYDWPTPARFYYMGDTFTNVAGLQGKLCESTQAGAELIGDGSVEADAEIIRLAVETLKAVGISQFKIGIGEVEYFKGLCEQAGLDTETERALRDKLSAKNIYAAAEVLEGANVTASVQEEFMRLADIVEDSAGLMSLKNASHCARSIDAVERLCALDERIAEYGIQEYVSYDLSMLTKYTYYTGIIFKAYTYGTGEPIARGGRYDELLGYFGKPAPAVGLAICVDDIMEVSRYGQQ